MSHFDNLPHELNRMIGSYLHYATRVGLYETLISREDKYIGKINLKQYNNKFDKILKSHVKKVNLSNMQRYLKYNDILPSNSNARIVNLIQVFNYIMNMKNKDDLLCYPKLRIAMYNKIREFTIETNFNNIPDLNENDKQRLIEACHKLEQYLLDNYGR